MEITFENLPKAVSQLFDKLENIEQLLAAERGTAKQDTEDLLTIQQAAEFLHLSVPTLYSHVSKSVIPHSKRGKRLYFSKRELTAWIQAGRKKTAAEITAEVETGLNSKKKKA
jgi:excisionase family DNA binding protein